MSRSGAATRPFHASESEAEIRRCSAELLLIPGASAIVHRLVAHHAYADAALSLFRSALPEYGFKLVIPPPLPNGAFAQAYASAWRRGESHAVCHRAATAPLALLKVAECECARRRETRLCGACRRCGGAGWFVTTAGMKEICVHATT